MLFKGLVLVRKSDNLIDRYFSPLLGCFGLRNEAFLRQIDAETLQAAHVHLNQLFHDADDAHELLTLFHQRRQGTLMIPDLLISRRFC